MVMRSGSRPERATSPPTMARSNIMLPRKVGERRHPRHIREPASVTLTDRSSERLPFLIGRRQRLIEPIRQHRSEVCSFGIGRIPNPRLMRVRSCDGALNETRDVFHVTERTVGRRASRQRRPVDQGKTLFRRIEHGKTIGDVRPRNALEHFEGVFVQLPWIGKPRSTKMRSVAPVRWEEKERIAEPAPGLVKLGAVLVDVLALVERSCIFT